MDKKPLLITVVRDEAMYRRCVVENPNCADCELLKFDNRAKNEFITVLYNRALNGLDNSTPRWLVFAHEDFEARESLAVKLAEADPNRIYGVIGGRLVLAKRWLLGGLTSRSYLGQVLHCRKDGSEESLVGASVNFGSEVETVDCMFLAVHSSLVERFHLRFDEHLSFDLYTEDFCINAAQNVVGGGVKTCILPLSCCHHSGGCVQPRFFEQMAYLDDKYPAPHEFFGAVGYAIGGGSTFFRRVQKRFWSFCVRHLPAVVRLRCWSFRPSLLRRLCLACLGRG